MRKKQNQLLKIGDNINFKILDEDGDFNQGALKVLENLKLK